MKHPTDLSEHIRRVVADAPPLTETQKHRLASLLQPAPPESVEQRIRRTLQPMPIHDDSGSALDEMLGGDHVG